MAEAPPPQVVEPPVATAKPREQKQPKTRPRKLPPYNVVLLDDYDHTYEYVIEMLGRLFGHSRKRAYRMAKEVDTTGRVIVLTTHKEKAELKRDQIHAYGADWRMERSRGSMRAVVEPAQGA